MKAHAPGLLLGIGTAAAAFAVTQGLWALSTPHSAWINLIFQLFPAPAVDECARLIAVFTPFAAARPGGFTFGFALFAALATLGLTGLEGGDALALIVTPILILALHVLLGFVAFAMAARKAAPFLVFCVLALIHGGSNGGLIALQGVAPPLAFLAAEIVLAALYGAGAIALVRSGQIPAAAKIG